MVWISLQIIAAEFVEQIGVSLTSRRRKIVSPKFFDALVKITGRDKMTETQAIQAVQISGAPNAYQQPDGGMAFSIYENYGSPTTGGASTAIQGGAAAAAS
jgi:hypothetical protein